MLLPRTVSTALLGSALIASGMVLSEAASADVVYEQARVVSADPVYRRVSYSVPTEQCSLVDEPVPAEPRYRSWTGPIVGAIIGGAIGNAVGHHKTNKKVGTAVGAVLGGSIGRDIQRRSEAARTQPVRWETREVCETVYETREDQELDGYDVTYRYAGQTYTTRMDRDPGRYLRVRVQVTPV